MTIVVLMIYFGLVSWIGTVGNGIILFAYGNRWGSAKSTSVIFILILACVDLWTCLVVVPTIAVIEYNDLEVPTPLCRFYSFSKVLIILSSLIMSFIALDRFLNIAVPHCRLLNPRRVKFLLAFFILVGIALGILTALAHSSIPYRESYHANYTIVLPDNESLVHSESNEISLTFDQKNSSFDDLVYFMDEQLSFPPGANITSVHLSYIATHDRCFADTSIISGTIRDVLRHISNKLFFTSIGVVTILYAITFVLALHRQNPRIRALKKSLQVLNKFDADPSNQQPQSNRHPLQQQRNDSIVSSYSPFYSSLNLKSSRIDSKRLSVVDNQQFEMSSFISNDDLDDQNVLDIPKPSSQIVQSDAQSYELHKSSERLPKQVSFQVENSDEILIDTDQQQLANSTTETYYKCPCSTTRQLLIKFHFAQPTLDINQWLCCWCLRSPPSLNDHRPSIINSNENIESLAPFGFRPSPRTSTSNSDTLRRQLHRHRLKQIRMASTFLMITVSFVLFYLPSILSAERFIKSPLMIYYLYLCTHALNPIIYCFMNASLRAYILAMLRCRSRTRKRSLTGGTTTILDR